MRAILDNFVSTKAPFGGLGERAMGRARLSVSIAAALAGGFASLTWRSAAVYGPSGTLRTFAKEGRDKANNVRRRANKQVAPQSGFLCIFRAHLAGLATIFG